MKRAKTVVSIDVFFDTTFCINLYKCANIHTVGDCLSFHVYVPLCIGFVEFRQWNAKTGKLKVKTWKVNFCNFNINLSVFHFLGFFLVSLWYPLPFFCRLCTCAIFKKIKNSFHQEGVLMSKCVDICWILFAWCF